MPVPEEVLYPNEYDELAAREKQIRALQLQLGGKDRQITALKNDKKIYLDRALLSEADIGAVRDALNAMTAEKGKLMRKIKRESNS